MQTEVAREVAGALRQNILLVRLLYGVDVPSHHAAEWTISLPLAKVGAKQAVRSKLKQKVSL